MEDIVSNFLRTFVKLQITKDAFLEYISTTSKRTLLYNIFEGSALSPIPKDISFGDEKGRGTYGRVFQVYGKDEVLKFVSIPPITEMFSTKEYLLHLRTLLIETFINYILSNDPDTTDFVPKLFGLYKYEEDEQKYLVIHMELGTKSLFDKFNEDISSHGVITWPTLMGVLLTITNMIKILYDKYRFSHRDLHRGNLFYFGDNLKLIDFGMSSITINVNGENYTISNYTYYGRNVPTNSKQDLALFLTDLYEHIYLYDALDDKGKELIELVFAKQMGKKPIEARNNTKSIFKYLNNKYQQAQLVPQEKHYFFHSAYNVTGNLFGVNNNSNLAKAARVFTPEALTEIIYYVEDDDHTDMPSVLINIPAKRPSLRNLLTRQRSRRHSTLRKFLPPPQRGGKTRKNKTVHNV